MKTTRTSLAGLPGMGKAARKLHPEPVEGWATGGGRSFDTPAAPAAQDEESCCTPHPEPVEGWATGGGRILAAAILLLAAGTGVARAQTFQTFEATQDIVFGTVATGQASGTITINAATGNTNTNGGITFFGGTVQRALFSGKAKNANKCTVTLTFPASVQLNGGGGTATLSRFRLSPQTIKLKAAQTFAFQVGARLTVPSGAPAATYAGTLTATVIFTDC